MTTVSVIVAVAVVNCAASVAPVAFCKARLMVSSFSVAVSALILMVKVFAVASPAVQLSVTGLVTV